jgi:hypothetical protein
MTMRVGKTTVSLLVALYLAVSGPLLRHYDSLSASEDGGSSMTRERDMPLRYPRSDTNANTHANQQSELLQALDEQKERLRQREENERLGGTPPTALAATSPPRNMEKWGTTVKDDGHAIFYNVYIQPNVTNERQGRIFHFLKDQIKQIENSTYGHQPTVYYNIIGLNYTGRLCYKQMDCRQIQHYTVGNEKDTPQDLFDFCTDRPDMTVTYLHNLGSVNMNPRNHVSRRIATQAALSDACRSISSSQCTSCSLNVQLQPSIHTSGNMWTAKCSYVRDLLSPNVFIARRDAMFRRILTSKDRFNFVCLDWLYNKSNNAMKLLSLGPTRAVQTWLFQHPDALPCSVLGNLSLAEVSDGRTWTPTLTMPPEITSPVRWHREMRLSWYKKQGRLYELNYFYRKSPSETNPFWKQYDHIADNPAPNCSRMIGKMN